MLFFSRMLKSRSHLRPWVAAHCLLLASCRAPCWEWEIDWLDCFPISGVCDSSIPGSWSKSRLKKRQENQCARTGKRIDWTLEEVENRWAGTRHRAYDAFRITQQAMILFSPFIIPPGWQPIITGTVLIGSGSIRPALLIEDFSRLFPAAACYSLREQKGIPPCAISLRDGDARYFTAAYSHGDARSLTRKTCPSRTR